MTHVCADHVSGLFSKSAASYAKYRPDYPQELYESILKRGKLPARDFTVGAATGSGKAAKGVSPFAKVIALNHNSEHLKHARHLPNVTFELGAGEKTGLRNNTVEKKPKAALALDRMVDVTRFDHDRIYPKMHRVSNLVVV
ncbi:TPA: hypothetical protein ACH3X2_008252 [Trebouxia sp. C0005]